MRFVSLLSPSRTLFATLAVAVVVAAAPARAEDAPAAPAVAATPVAATEIPAGDPALGERVFNKCRGCHMVGEGARNSVGPVLNGVVGRKAGIVEGYNYSEANKGSGLVWDEATLREYLHGPQAKVKGTKMMFAGLTSETEISNLIAYLKSFDATGKKTP